MGDSIMASIIRATTTSGLQIAPDNSGSLILQTNGTTAAVTVDTSQNTTFAGKVTSAGALTLASNGTTTALTIDTSQNVGIGTSSPTFATGTGLQVKGAGFTSVRITGASSTGVDFSQDASANGYMYNRDNAALIYGTNNTERMRITSGGEVYIAGTTDQGAYNLQCNGTGVWGAGAYVNGSDSRIKDDIQPISSSLDVVNKLNPVTFKYKEDWSKDQSVQTGFIAQELQETLKDEIYIDGLVNTGGEYLSVAYQNIIPLLTKAIQEQQAIINDLKARVEALEAK